METLSNFLKNIDACAWRSTNMAAYLLCLTADGGIPLFTRTRGNLPQLPFPAVGSLNGVQMFAKNLEAKLLNTCTDDAKIVWHTFHESLSLILVASDDNASDIHMNNLLKLVFNSMVLLLGLDELTTIRNVEVLKRQMRGCYGVIDSLLDGTDLVGDLVQAVDVILSPDVSILQEHLDTFVTAVNSEFGCLLVMGKIAVATERWWELTGIELVLLSLLIKTLPPCSSRDIPVYLPYGSPKIPHRLMTFQIIEGVEVCIICGPVPTLEEVEQKYLAQYWSSSLESLKACLRGHPRNLPSEITVDSGVLGFILVNTEERKCLSSVYPCGVMTGVEATTGQGMGLPLVKRKSVLTSFFKSIVGSLFPPIVSPGEESEVPLFEPCGNAAHQAMETYVCADDYKCYATRNATHQLFLLFSREVPNYALGPLSSETLTILTKDHLV